MAPKNKNRKKPVKMADNEKAKEDEVHENQEQNQDEEHNDNQAFDPSQKSQGDPRDKINQEDNKVEDDEVRGSINDTTVTNDQTMQSSFVGNEEHHKNNEEIKMSDGQDIFSGIDLRDQSAATLGTGAGAKAQSFQSKNVEKMSLDEIVLRNSERTTKIQQLKLQDSKNLQDERARVEEILDYLSQKTLEYNIMFNNLKKPIYLDYENLDKHYQELQDILKQCDSLLIPDDLIKAEFRQELEYLENERLRQIDEKEGVKAEIENRIKEVEALIDRRNQEEEDKILREAQAQAVRENYEGALQVLAQSMHYKAKEQQSLIQNIQDQQKQKQLEEERKVQEEQRRVQEEIEYNKRQEEERIQRENDERRKQAEEDEHNRRVQQEQELRIKEEEKLRREQEQEEIKAREEIERLQKEEEIEFKRREKEAKKQEKKRLRELQEQELKKKLEEEERQQKQENEERRRLLEAYKSKQGENHPSRSKADLLAADDEYTSPSKKQEEELFTGESIIQVEQTQQQAPKQEDKNGSNGGIAVMAALGVIIAGGLIIGYNKYLKR